MRWSRCAPPCVNYQRPAVPEYRLSRLALADLNAISQYTVRQWGVEQAERYITELDKMLKLLAASPAIGRTCDRIRKGYRRMEHGRHIIFYRTRPRDAGIDVMRVLHERMLPAEHLEEK